MTDIPGQLHHDSEFQRASNTLDAVHAPRHQDIGCRIDLLAAQRDEARGIVARVIDLHRAEPCELGCCTRCAGCGLSHPCPTARIVLPDTDQPADGAA